jgi:hypothetical protein
MTVLSLQDLANLGLKILARDGLPTDGAANTDKAGWQVVATAANGTPFDISLAGADIPAVLDEEIIPPAQVAEDLGWKGAYRLRVRAPLIVFDIYWSPGEPLRIMTFSRGDWEMDLAKLAG